MTSVPGASVRAAITDPVVDAFERRAGSIRRTSHIDMHRGDGGRVTLDGRARDLVSGDSDVVVAEAAVRADCDADGTLTALEVVDASGAPADVAPLVGRPIRHGFRRALAEVVPDLLAARSPSALLLDDLPVAFLVSGYAKLYGGGLDPAVVQQAMEADICAGWVADGTMMASVRAGDGVPVTIGPPVPTDPDGAGWHRVPDLPAGSMRRRRLVDVEPGGGVWRVTATFRDSHVDPEGDATVLHEYVVRATVDAATGRFTTCAAEPRVLPWPECPSAAASASRLVGRLVGDVGEIVGRDFRGISTCTHLNDLLRSLADVPTLVASVARA